MKDKMAYPAGMLIRKDGNIRFQYRVPKDLKQFYPRAVMSENLGTTDKAVAARLIYKRKAELEQEFERHRAARDRPARPPESLKTSITHSEAIDLAQAMLASTAQADEEIRHEGLGGEVYAPESFAVTESPMNTDAVRQAAARGDYSAFNDVVMDWLWGHGYAIPADSPDFRKVAREFAKATHRALDIVRQRDEGNFVDSPAAPSVPRTAAREDLAATLMLSTVVGHFLDGCDKNAPMFKKYQAALALLLEYIGDKQVSDLKQLDLDGYFGMLSKLPPRWSDIVRKRGIPVRELAKEVHAVTLSPKTFEGSYKAAVRPFLAEAKRVFGDSGFPWRLTVEGIKYKGNQKEGARKQRAFTNEELKRLFEGPEYAAFAADPDSAAEYWMPLIGLYTGARVNEICQLNPQCDIREEDGVWFFDFTVESAADERVKKSLKTPGSRRKTPIHNHLIDLGLLAYVDRMKQQGRTLMFPKWVPTRGRASPAGEDWFRQFLAEVGLRDETHGRTVLGMHAFRHTLLTYAYNQNIANMEAITGHAGEGSSVVRGYRGELTLPNKKAILDTLTYNIAPPPPTTT